METDVFTSEELSSVANTVVSATSEEFIREAIDAVIAKQLTYTYRVLLQELQEMVLQEEDQLNATLKNNPNLNKGQVLEAAERHFELKEREMRDEYKRTKESILKHREYLIEQSHDYFFYQTAYGDDYDGIGKDIHPC